MTIDEFRNALRSLLNDAIRSGLDIDVIIEAAEEEIHPAFESAVGQRAQAEQ